MYGRAVVAKLDNTSKGLVLVAGPYSIVVTKLTEPSSMRQSQDALPEVGLGFTYPWEVVERGGVA